MEIVFVRHGEKEESKEGNLSEEGKRQAKKLSKKLKEENFDEFYSSNLLRARQTSEEISKAINKKPEIKNCLNEITFDILKKPKILWPKETRTQMKNLKNFLNEISKNPNKERKVLISCHGNINKIILGHFQKLKIKDIVTFRQSNCGANRLYWEEKFNNWRVFYWNRIVE